MTYAELKADVAAWIHRTDLAAMIPSFISLAEEDIYKTSVDPLRVREMETEVVISDNTVPADYLESRYIRLNDSSNTVMYFMPPDNWSKFSNNYFTIVGNTIKLPDSVSSDITLVYYAKPASLSSDFDTNAVLENYYNIYLKAALKQAYIFVRDLQMGQETANGLLTLLQNANIKNKPAISGALQVRVA